MIEKQLLFECVSNLSPNSRSIWNGCVRIYSHCPSIDVVARRSMLLPVDRWCRCIRYGDYLTVLLTYIIHLSYSLCINNQMKNEIF